MKKTFLLGQIIFLFSCSNKYLRTPPIPTSELSVDEEMKYIENTDQADRRATAVRLILHNGRTIKRIINRDSIRLYRILEFKKADLLQSDVARFSAGLVFKHNGLPKRALFQFNQIIANTKDSAMMFNARTFAKLCIKDTTR